MTEQGLPLQGVPAPIPSPLHADLPQSQAPQQPAHQVVHLSWCHFMAEFSGKPDQDTEVHQLCTNDWMTAHHFVEGIKVQRFCLTLLGKARLWYQSLEPINVNWQGLQNLLGNSTQK